MGTYLARAYVTPVPNPATLRASSPALSPRAVMTRANTIAITVIFTVILLVTLFGWYQQDQRNQDNGTDRLVESFCASEGLDC